MSEQEENLITETTCSATKRGNYPSVPAVPHGSNPLLPPFHSFLKNDGRTYHTAEKERNARTITTAMEPSPMPTICGSKNVSDEPVRQKPHAEPTASGIMALSGAACPPVLTLH